MLAVSHSLGASSKTHMIGEENSLLTLALTSIHLPSSAIKSIDVKEHILNFILISHALLFGLDICLHGDVGSPRTGVMDSYNLPCGCWELLLALLEEQPVLFNY